MGEDLLGAQRRIEEERRRLAVTIESLGDAPIVTELDSRIAAVNPRVGDLVPELVTGRRIDDEDSPLPTLAEALSGETVVEHNGRTL